METLVTWAFGNEHVHPMAIRLLAHAAEDNRGE